MPAPAPSRRDVVATVGAAALLPATCPLALAAGESPVIHQLRVYEIFDGNKDAFHARFRDACIPIMTRHGFDIAALWEAKGERGPEFVYLLRWPDEAAMASRWAAFMADPDWSRIKDETSARHGQMVGAIQSRVMHLTGYSGAA